jgi:hypothetical protein
MKPQMKRRSNQRQDSGTKPAQAAEVKRSRTERSMVKRLMGILKSGGDARVAKVKRVRQSVRTKTYENDLKLSIALDRMTRDLSA